jgi:hypothetical protein
MSMTERVADQPQWDGPPPARALWRTWAGWVIGVPAFVLGALAIICATIWLTGEFTLYRAISDMGEVLVALAVLAVLWPIAAIPYTLDLRNGLRARAAWNAMRPEHQAAVAADDNRGAA